ncbi:uncharacterized protein DUF3857 [Lacibacter cauensis]|uniref:Uncharacterized protein DUF3857 n=1 Tax=Lacibacter cauensis TaxID=510947 RepID=A0A562SI73_9BACT|nr:DUF3857 domain-containing protein [Lacibacter cauensis]TWI80440.1 uncharacterized protein DUF3857 [Lacibacter cauensis]
MKKLIAFLLIVVGCTTLKAQGLLNYSSLTLPDSLKKDADAVYHLEEQVIEIESPSRMKIKSHIIVTVLTKAALRHSVQRISVDKLRKLEEIKIKVYNELGLEIDKFNKKDFKLEGAFDGVTLASDDKIYELDFPVPGTPCTIEVEYELNCNGFIDIPSWFFGSSTESFKKSRYVVKSAIPVKYKAYNFTKEPVITTEDDKKVYTWELLNKPVPAKEPNSYGAKTYLPWVDVSPLQFSYDGYAGSLESWKEFGKWSYPFYEEKNGFTPERAAFFQSLVKDAKNEKEKIEILYSHMQKEMRYVSIQFGIGGFKPFPISFAEQKKYGDCKGLTHYMKQMLSTVGIKSLPALINSGSNQYPVDAAFASNMFDHVILCVPLKTDTMWLECTSKQNQPGVLGPFTENRNALLITEAGGVLAKTPASNSYDNQWRSETTAELFDDGSAILSSRVYVTGEFWDYVHAYLNGRTKEQMKKSLTDAFGYKVPNDLLVNILGDSANGHLIEIKLAYNQLYDFKSGSKHFFPLRQYKLNDETIKPAEKRNFDYLFAYPYIKTDKITYKLPADFVSEPLSQPKEIKNNIVSYNNKLLLNESKTELTVITELQLQKHIVPANLYNDIANSFEAIRKDEGQKIIFKKG